MAALRRPSCWAYSEHSLLRLQLPLVRHNERPDVIGHPQELEPLLLVKRHRKTPHPIDRERALLADFHGNARGSPLFERSVLVTQALELGLQIIVCHRYSLSFRNEPLG